MAGPHGSGSPSSASTPKRSWGNELRREAGALLGPARQRFPLLVEREAPLWAGGVPPAASNRPAGPPRGISAPAGRASSRQVLDRSVRRRPRTGLLPNEGRDPLIRRSVWSTTALFDRPDGQQPSGHPVSAALLHPDDRFARDRAQAACWFPSSLAASAASRRAKRLSQLPAAV
jgi:hypothetical protein